MNLSSRLRLGVRASLGSWLFAVLLAGTAHAADPGDDHNARLARDAVRSELERELQQNDCCQPLVSYVAQKREARAGFTTLFTSEGGSWPFEFIGHTGLLALIADYQPEHPRAVQVFAGRMTLEALARRIGNPDVIRPFRDGFLLSYPLIVSTNAQLDITDTSLYLAGRAGALIINRGDLMLRNAKVQAWEAEDVTNQLDVFRPFILGWAGSRMFVHDSEFSDLGYQANLSTGITLARHERQVGGPNAEVTVTGSQFHRLAIPISASGARLSIEDSEFRGGLLSELHITDSQLALQNSQFPGTTLGNSAQSTIRIQGDSDVLVHGNDIRHAHKAAIELSEVSGHVVISDNSIKLTDGDGLLIRNSAVRETPIAIKGNSIQHSQRSAVDAAGPGHLLLAGNTLGDSGRYAVSFSNEGAEATGKLVLLNNHLAAAGESLIRTHKMSTLGLYGNEFTLAAYRDQVFAGDSAPFQAALMRGLAIKNCDLELIRKVETTTLVGHPVTIGQSQECIGELASSDYW